MAEAIQDSILEAGRELGYPHIKQEQVEVATVFLERKDVFAILSTGFGKSVCYVCLPTALDILNKKERGYSIVVVISPLIAIMTDQVKCSCVYSELIFEFIVMHAVANLKLPDYI